MHILLYSANPTAENRVYVQVRSEAPPPGNEPRLSGWCIGGQLNPCAPEKNYVYSKGKVLFEI